MIRTCHNLTIYIVYEWLCLSLNGLKILNYIVHYVSLFMDMEIGKNRDKSNYVVIQISNLIVYLYI